MKNILLIILLSFFISCSKNTYYVYQDDSTYSYCTVEITKKKDVIYRASSSNYSSNYFESSKFIYLSSLNDNYNRNINKDTIGFENVLLEMFYIDYKYPINFKYALIENKYDSSLSISFVRTKNDTIKTRYYLKNIEKDPSLKKAGIKWFPPYLVKVDKLDYSKFPKEIQLMNLKNPNKQKSNEN